VRSPTTVVDQGSGRYGVVNLGSWAGSIRGMRIRRSRIPVGTTKHSRTNARRATPARRICAVGHPLSKRSGHQSMSVRTPSSVCVESSVNSIRMRAYVGCSRAKFSLNRVEPESVRAKRSCQPNLSRNHAYSIPAHMPPAHWGRPHPEKPPLGSRTGNAPPAPRPVWATAGTLNCFTTSGLPH
jgi:hypothetical protein